MTFYYDNLKEIALAVNEYIDKLDLQDKIKFCNLGSQLINNKSAKPYCIAGAICKHYIIDKSEKIYIVYPAVEDMLATGKTKLKAKHIAQLDKFNQFKQLGRLIAKIFKQNEKLV